MVSGVIMAFNNEMLGFARTDDQPVAPTLSRRDLNTSSSAGLQKFTEASMNIAAEKRIIPGSEVQMHFTIKLSDGSVADSTLPSGRPACFKLGENTLTDTVEQSIIGLQAGDKKSLTLTPEEGFGLPNPANIYELPKTQFPTDIPLEQGLIMGFTQPNGVELPGIIREFNDTTVTVDFNHPLSGQTLIFDLEIVAVDP